MAYLRAALIVLILLLFLSLRALAVARVAPSIGRCGCGSRSPWAGRSPHWSVRKSSWITPRRRKGLVLLSQIISRGSTLWCFAVSSRSVFLAKREVEAWPVVSAFARQ